MDKVLQTPILFILYNRLHTAQKAFAQIRQVHPQRLYIACDGYKTDKEGDREKVLAVRQWVLNAIDWKCEIKTRFSEQNQGCKCGPANAINWVFENEEEAIILEDDIVADESFFWYCQDMLKRYKNDTRIMLVSGHKAVWDFPVSEDYLFSALGTIWGWATWRRAWNFFDIEMKKWPYFKEKGLLRNVYGKNAAISLTDSMDATYTGKLDAWDYPWTFAQVLNSGLTILPRYNLIENIGYGSDATHTSGGEIEFCTGSLEFPLKSVENVVRNWDYDRAYAREFLKVKKFRRFIRRFIPRPILIRWYRLRGVEAYNL